MDGTFSAGTPLRPRIEWRIDRPSLQGLRLRRLLFEPVAATALLTLAASAIFMLFPAIDLAVSAAFHRPNEGFVAAADPALRALRKSSTWVMAGLMLAVLVTLGVRLTAALRRGGAAPACVRRPLCLLAVFALGPGLLVNGVLKALWGRARPVDVLDFGGTDLFTPAWTLSRACADNCSFTSGEGASAAWMATVLMLAPARWRALAALPLLPYALLLSLNRVAFGGHFLSDVVLSWCLTGLIAAVAWRLMVTTPAAGRARRTRRRTVRGGSTLPVS